MKKRVLFAASALLAVGAAQATEPSCGEARYFAPTDYYRQSPLSTPHAELQKRLKLAGEGNALEQRNLAISYAAGYLVDECPARSRYWYRKAAAAGDAVAKDWVATDSFFTRMRSGPECAGQTCPVAPGGVPAMVQLQPGQGGMYFAPVTINGVTVNGIIDTGATFVSISSGAAKQMGISFEGGRQVTLMTANGTKQGNLVHLEKVTVSGITLTSVQAVVSEGVHPVLVGMSFLGRLSVSVSGSGMVLSRARIETAPASGETDED